MRKLFVLKQTSTTDFAMPLPHTHTYYEMCIIFNGDRDMHVEKHSYPLLNNDLIIIPPHTLHLSKGGAYTIYLIHFEKEILDSFQYDIVNFSQLQKISMSQEEADRIFYLSESMYNINKNSNIKNDKKDYFLSLLFGSLIYEFSILKNFPSQRFKRFNGFSSLSKQIISYIEKNYAKNITLESLAKQFFFSKTTLNNDFKKNIGLSIIDYVLKKRINVAQVLLVNTKKSINEIAEECGFSSQNYFYRIFRKFIGVPPTQYRKLS